MAEATDVVLVGGGIMSATLGVLLKELEPSWEITLIERLEDVALESSNAWNNAGTGHSALCELNYAPLTADGTIDPTRRPQYCRTIPYQPPILGDFGRRRQTDRPHFHQFRPPYVAGDERRPLQLSAKRFDVFKKPKTLRKNGVFYRPCQNRRMGAAGYQRP